jgi:hypothetical protein
MNDDKNHDAWIKSLANVIPKIKTPLQLVAFALVVILLILQVSRGLNTFVSCLTILTVIVIFLASSIANRIETAKSEGVTLIIYYCGLIIFAIIALFLAYYVQIGPSTPGQLTWAGGHLRRYVDVLDEYEHVNITFDAKLSEVVICKELMKFHGLTPYDILEDVACKNNNCLLIQKIDENNVAITPGTGQFIWSEADKCHKCNTV